MSHSVSKYFVLAYGGPAHAVSRLEVRNANFELLGHCRIDDLDQFHRLLGQAEHLPSLTQILATLPLGRITSIVL